jgi:L-iditol 2-dehydrogenase
MKALVLEAPEKMEIREVEKPKIDKDELLIKLGYCGICTLEVRLYRGDMEIYYPIIPGHEASGIVVEKGWQVLSAIEPGTKVALDLVTRCNECYYCRSGKSNMCENRFKKGNRVLGGFAEYISVKATQVFPLPDSITLAEAAFAEPIACCIRSLKNINITLAEDLLIAGAGPMGIMHLQAALCMGVRVFISDPDKNRRKLAEELGAYLAIDPGVENIAEVVKEHTGGRGVDGYIITSPAPEALEHAFEAIARDGRVNIYTSYNEKAALPVDANTLHRNEYLITGSEGRTEHDFLQAVRLLSFGKIKVKPLISKITDFENIEEGMNAAMSNGTYRVLLKV